MKQTPIPRQRDVKPARKYRERRPNIGRLIRQAEDAGKRVTAAVRRADGTTHLTFAGPSSRPTDDEARDASTVAQERIEKMKAAAGRG